MEKIKGNKNMFEACITVDTSRKEKMSHINIAEQKSTVNVILGLK